MPTPPVGATILVATHPSVGYYLQTATSAEPHMYHKTCLRLLLLPLFLYLLALMCLCGILCRAFIPRPWDPCPECGGPGIGPPVPPAESAELELHYPSGMPVDSQAVITAEILANPDGATATLTCLEQTEDGDHYILTATTPVYPIMTAELLAPNFQVSPTRSDARRVVTTSRPAWWVWAVAPTKPGLHELSVNLHGEVPSDDQTALFVPASHNTFKIRVLDRPLPEKLLDAGTENFDIVALTAVLATAVGASVALLRERRTTRTMAARIQALENLLATATPPPHHPDACPPTKPPRSADPSTPPSTQPND